MNQQTTCSYSSDSDQINSNAELTLAIRRKNQSEQQKLVQIQQIFQNHPWPNIYAQDYDDNHNTALHMAVRRGYLDIVNFLLAQGADSLIQNKQKKTCLDMAKERNFEDIIVALENSIHHNNQWLRDICQRDKH